jgi:hypothetical protein
MRRITLGLGVAVALVLVIALPAGAGGGKPPLFPPGEKPTPFKSKITIETTGTGFRGTVRGVKADGQCGWFRQVRVVDADDPSIVYGEAGTARHEGGAWSIRVPGFAGAPETEFRALVAPLHFSTLGSGGETKYYVCRRDRSHRTDWRN